MRQKITPSICRGYHVCANPCAQIDQPGCAIMANLLTFVWVYPKVCSTDSNARMNRLFNSVVMFEELSDCERWFTHKQNAGSVLF